MTLSDYEQGVYVPPPAPRQRRHGRYVVATVLLGTLALGATLLMTNRQYVVDQWTIWNYTPTSVIETYIARSSMTEHAEFLFRASRPIVADAESFNQVCKNLEGGSGILGCYVGKSKVITLFDITDVRLDGMEEVVAAHEMLHAAWDRMSPQEQARLTTLLNVEADALSGDANFVARMELYARTEPGERDNELHSIIGTEIADLSQELDEYYAKYFGDRQALVALHVQSKAVFLALEAQSAALVSELDALNSSIAADGERYNAGYDQLNADINRFNARADAGEFTSQREFDNERAALLAREAELDALLVSIKAREATWSEKQAQLEQVNAQAAALNTAINVVPRSAEE